MSPISPFFAAAAAVMPLMAGAVQVFDAQANTNMAVYWGQGPNQQRLAHFCADTNIDIIPIGFVNQFPDQTGGYPGTNFGNQCGATYYKNTDGSTSQLLNSCPDIGPDIKTCQALGKKILLSIGGAIPNNQHLKSTASATAFATFLWRAFGPDKEASGSTFPRPFGTAAVDGFDFDIENVLAKGENSQDLYYGYSTMISTLRDFYSKEPTPHYISGAPQCIVPDAHLANAIQYSHFDFLFVQFYNTAQCSARAYFDHTYGAYGGPATNISFDAWVSFVQKYSNNRGIKVFLGLPASNSNQVVTDSKMYLQPAEAQKIIDAFQCKYPTVFGGVMLYEATFSEENSINGKPYADVLKGYLTSSKCAAKRTVDPSIISPASVSSLLPNVGADPTTPTSCPGNQACFSDLASNTDPALFCTLNDEIGPLPLPNGEGSSCSGAQISSACQCYTAPATASSTPSSSSAPYPTGSSNITSGPTGSAPSASRTYTRPSGSPIVSANSTSSVFRSGTAPYPRSTGTAPIRSTGTAPLRSGTAPLRSGTAPLSSGSLPSSKPIIPSSSKIPYPLTNSSAPVTSSEAPSSTESSGASTTEIITTEIVTSYTTVCPVTSTYSSGGSQVVSTGLTTSTVYVTEIITVCTRCTAKPTPTPSSSVANLPAVSSKSASAQVIVTTVIVYTTQTTCPVTQTIISAGSTLTQTTESISTITVTTTSTILPTSKAPAFAPQGPSKTAAAGVNSPAQGSNAPANSPAPGSSNTPTQGGANGNSPAAGSNSLANGAAGASSASVPPKVETLTIVPVAETATETNYVAKPTLGAQSGSGPFPAKNGTSSAASFSAASASASKTAPSPFQPSTEAFKGAGSQLTGGVGVSIVVAIFVSLML